MEFRMDGYQKRFFSANKLFLSFFSVFYMATTFGMQVPGYPWPIFPLFPEQDAHYEIKSKKGVMSLRVNNSSRSEKIPYFEKRNFTQMEQLALQLAQSDIDQQKEPAQRFTVQGSAYVQYLQQRNHILTTIFNVLHKSIDAQLVLPTLQYDIKNQPTISSQLNDIFNKSLRELCDTSFAQDGQLKVLTQKDYEKIAYTLGVYLLQFLPDQECLKIVRQAEQAGIKGFKEFREFLESWSLSLKLTQEAIKDVWKKGVNFFTDSDAKHQQAIIDNQFNTDLNKIRNLYQESQFEEAHEIIDEYRERFRKKRRANTITDAEREQELLLARYRRQLIKHSQPMQRLQAIKDSSNSDVVQQVSIQVENQLIRHKTESDVTQQLVSSLYDIPANSLQSDENKEFKAAYDLFFNKKGLPTLFNYNDQALAHATIPAELQNVGHAKERMLLFKLASIKSTDAQFNKFLGSLISQLSAGMADTTNGHIYRVITQACYNALVNDKVSQTILDCPSFFQTPSSAQMRKLYDKTLDHVKTILTSIEQGSVEQQVCLEEALEALHRTWQRAIKGDKKAQEYLNNDFLSATSFLTEEAVMMDSLSTDSYLESTVWSEELNKQQVDLLITNNHSPINYEQFEKYKNLINILKSSEKTPHLDFIEQLIDDGDENTRAIKSFCADALEQWSDAQTTAARELAATAFLYGEIAYNHAQQNDNTIVSQYIELGRELLKYAQAAGNVVHRKAKNIYEQFNNALIYSDHFLSFAAKSLAHSTHLLIDGVNRFNSIVTAGNFRLPWEQLTMEEIIRTEPEFRMQKMQELLDDGVDLSELYSPEMMSAICFMASIACKNMPLFQIANKGLTLVALAGISMHFGTFFKLTGPQMLEVLLDGAIDMVLHNKFFGAAANKFDQLRKRSDEFGKLMRAAQKAGKTDVVNYCKQEIAKINKAGEVLKKAGEHLVSNMVESHGQPPTGNTNKTPWPNTPCHTIVNEFLKHRDLLEKKYGAQTVKEAIDYFNLDDAQKITTLTKRNIAAGAKETVVQQIEHMVQDIIDLDKDQRWKPLRFDIGKGKCDANSLEEVLIARKAEQNGLLPKIKCRDTRANAGDFIDVNGQSWDVKGMRSYSSPTQEYIFNKNEARKFVNSINNELAKPTNENIILNVSHLTQQDAKYLFETIKNKVPSNHLKRIIVVDRFTEMYNSCNFSQFLNEI